MTGPVHGAYFYLSHARMPSMVIDHWVRKFYDDLFEAVRRLGRRQADLEIGFGDFLPPGADRDAEMERAVGAARVFVPLYSPEYVDSPPRDRVAFLSRWVDAGAKTGNVQPVLWAPLAPGREFPDLASALELGADLPDYARHGLSAMCRLRVHAGGYEVLVQRLAARIVDAAERAAPVPKTVRQTVELPPSQPEISFIIAVIAPNESRMPPRRQAMCYGSRSTAWRPFRNSHSAPIADYTAQVAASLMMPTRIVDFIASDNRLDTSPGVILIDPWVLAQDDGRAMLRAAFAALRRWVTLVVVVDRNDPQYETGSALADEVMRMGHGAAGHKVVRDVREFEQQVGRLIARTRLQYLNKSPKPGPETTPPPGAPPPGLPEV